MPMYKKSMVVFLVLLAAMAGGTFYGYYSQGEEISLDTAEKPVGASEEKLTVYVTGAVNHPGVLTLGEGARAADAVNACGGVLPTADMEKVNMAQMLKDGQQLLIPEKTGKQERLSGGKVTGEEVKGKHASGKSNGKDEKGGIVNINTADESELDTLPGIGPSMAKRIVEFRQTEGAFQSPEDLKKVRGIGDAKFEKLKDRISV